jgi:uncharacterized protein
MSIHSSLPKPSRLKRYSKRFLLGCTLLILSLYMGLSLGLYFKQRTIIYLPEKTLNTPQFYGLKDAEELSLLTPDGVSITAWYNVNSPQNKTLVYFQGNASNLGHRTKKLNAFISQGFNVMAVSYRGYGNSGGSPSEEGLYRDGRTAIQYLLGQQVPIGNIILYGESLGSGVAVQLGTEFKVGAVVLESPYTSLVNIGKKRYPIIPISLLLKDRFESWNKIHNVHSPILIFHGQDDQVVPVTEGKLLLGLANEPKQGMFLKGIGHSDFNIYMLAEQTKRFVDSSIAK